MRLQLESPNLTSTLTTAETIALNSARSSAGSRASAEFGDGDSIGLSGPSAALGRLTEERTVRIGQLTAAVRAGTYRVPAAAVSAAIVAQAGA